MTGIITSLPPLIEQPPGNNASNPAVLPGVTYTFALLGLAQTWTAKQTFPLGNISLNAADILGLAPSATVDTTNASNLTSGTLNAARLPPLNPLIIPKTTPTGAAPGAGLCAIQAVAGTLAGSCKIIVYAGTSATPITLIDNIGTGF